MIARTLFKRYRAGLARFDIEGNLRDDITDLEQLFASP
jgi:hypothetical protein